MVIMSQVGRLEHAWNLCFWDPEMATVQGIELLCVIINQGPVVRSLDNFIQQINPYPTDIIQSKFKNAPILSAG